MEDAQVSRGRVVAGIWWAAVVGLIVMGWVVQMFGPWEVAVGLWTSACATSAMAATMHIRTYSVRICHLIRVTQDLERQIRSEVTRPTPVR